jgi:hypothetical protein
MAGIRDKIRRWNRDGVSFRVIEDRINALPASEEEKSALWLWAWSFRGHRSPTYGQRAQGLLAD